jgi:hypothetical protein
MASEAPYMHVSHLPCYFIFYVKMLSLAMLSNITVSYNYVSTLTDHHHTTIHLCVRHKRVHKWFFKIQHIFVMQHGKHLKLRSQF